jgi:hypothetical protein
VAIYDAPTLLLFSSWTDADLVRAIELVDGEQNPEQARAEYVAELARRAIDREHLAEQTARIQNEVAAKIRALIGEE